MRAISRRPPRAAPLRGRVLRRRRTARAHPRVIPASTSSDRGAAAATGRSMHLNGHIDVVPAGDGWTVDPFGGLVRDGRIYGRGVCDMKAGLAAAVFAAEAIERAGVRAAGHDRDQRHGGRRKRRLRRRRVAGARCGRIAKARTDYVIIPEPLNVDRICIGHRGVYWFELTTRGRIGARQHAVSRRQRDRRHGPRCCGAISRRADAGAGAARVTVMPVVPRGCAARDDQRQRASTAVSRSTASRRRASPIAAARCSIAGS